MDLDTFTLPAEILLSIYACFVVVDAYLMHRRIKDYRGVYFINHPGILYCVRPALTLKAIRRYFSEVPNKGRESAGI